MKVESKITELPSKIKTTSFWNAANTRTLLSGVFIGIALVASISVQVEIDSLGMIPFFVISIFCGAWQIVPKAFVSIKKLRADMNLLMTIAVLGAMIIGEWFEAAMVTFLFSLSELLESYSVTRARNAVKSLLDMTPKTAWLKKTDSLQEVPVEQIQVGDILVVKSGAQVPLDGEVISGNSTVNQAPITGESLPVQKQKGDFLFAGSINGGGSLEFLTTKPYSESTLSRIIHLIEEAQIQKAPAQRFIDVFSKYYTPAVIAISLFVVLLLPLVFREPFQTWFYRGLVLLVISCPCALVISTPISLVSGLTSLARKGVLVKGGATLEAIGKLRALAVDKTGTITRGTPQVMQVICVNSNDEKNIVNIAASIDIHSDHPLAQAIITYVEQQHIKYKASDDFQEISGKGATASVGKYQYFVGNHRFIHELNLCSESLEEIFAGLEKEAKSVVVVGSMPRQSNPGEVLGILAISDPVRKSAYKTITSLHKLGVQKIVMLSGDNQYTVDAIANQVGIDIAQGDLLPHDKTSWIERLVKEYRYVGMVGDGVNDAPAMALATIGIAMGKAGTDTAIETADIVLMQDNIETLPTAMKIGRATLSTIKINVAFALIVKTIFLVLAILGYTSLWLAILADTGATLVVIANSLRLLKVGSQTKKYSDKNIDINSI